VVTNQTSSILVGDQVQTEILTQRPAFGIVWVAEGGAIEDWLVSYAAFQDPNSTATIKPLRTNINPLLAMWPFGSVAGSTYKLTCVFVVYGRTYGRRTFYKVFKPDVPNGIGIDADYTNQIMADDTWDPNVQAALHLGEVNEFRPGMRFTFGGAVMPAGFPNGNYEWVQVVQDSSRRSYSDGVDVFAKIGGGLDTTYPYAQVTTLQNTTFDSPGLEITSTYPNVSIKDDYLMYLMFIPPARDVYRSPKYAPLKEIAWGWRANAAGTFEGQTFVSATITNPSLIGPGIGDADRYPLWSRNWKGIPYVKQ
jgi:hypothetical protein